MSLLDSLPERWRRDLGVAGIGFCLGMAASLAYWRAEIVGPRETSPAELRDASPDLVFTPPMP